MSSKPVFLDADPSIIENNLNFLKEAEEEEFNKILGFPSPASEGKVIKPYPGLCIKTREVDNFKKVFINVCKTDAIPAPENISEEDVSLIIHSATLQLDDRLINFKVPMSIGALRIELDHNNESAKVCDVAINTAFFDTLEHRPALKKFFYCVLFEGLKEKHQLICVDEGIILKNKKAFGNLQTHVIRKSVIEEKMQKDKSPIEVLQGQKVQEKPKIEVLEGGTKTPDYRLYVKNDDSDVLYAEFRLPDVINAAKELTLDVGMDRVLLESKARGYLVDIFIPMYVNQMETVSTFDKLTKVLTVVMPIINIPGFC